MRTESTTSATVLLLDDDITFLYALSEALRTRLNWVNVETCSSATQALRQIEVTDYDAIVSDIKMPVLDGLELLAAIRSRCLNTPVIMITSYQEYQVAVKALRWGAYDIIQKPINWEYFATSLSSAIYSRQIERLQESKASSESSLHNRALLANLKVLLVDDDAGGREIQSTALAECGAEVLAVSSVSEALAIFEQFDPDLLISDLRMPLEDGYSLMRKLQRRAAKPGMRLPAVAVTAYADEEQRQQTLRAGYQLQLAKPLAPDTLVLTVAYLAGRL